ncbi:MAG: hypothetical protein ACAH27_05620 [Xanthobacteraceae bacterium]
MTGSVAETCRRVIERVERGRPVEQLVMRCVLYESGLVNCDGTITAEFGGAATDADHPHRFVPGGDA